MNIEQLKESGQIILSVIAGSQAYGTNTPESDIDIRGVFRTSKENLISLNESAQQVSDSNNDVTYYELRKFFQLISTCSPNMIELLWTPDDCIIERNNVADCLFQNRDLFISKKAYSTFSGYAFSQISRAKGQNKWINNKKPETPPRKEDFCWVIPFNASLDIFPVVIGQVKDGDEMPFRPIPIFDSAFNMEEYHVAKLEHVENTYRLYYYGKNAKGVFRGDSQQLVVESIPIEDEWSKFAGLLIWNEQAYERAKTDWKNYWEWRNNRNESRYRSQEAGEIDYDAKSMLHCMRLLKSGKSILETGSPIVRFTGSDLQYLRDIRAGKFKYEELMAAVEADMEELKVIKEKSSIRNDVDLKKINKLYVELVNC